MLVIDLQHHQWLSWGSLLRGRGVGEGGSVCQRLVAASAPDGHAQPEDSESKGRRQ